jgi:hypothetical protein
MRTLPTNRILPLQGGELAATLTAVHRQNASSKTPTPALTVLHRALRKRNGNRALDTRLSLVKSVIFSGCPRELGGGGAPPDRSGVECTPQVGYGKAPRTVPAYLVMISVVGYERNTVQSSFRRSIGPVIVIFRLATSYAPEKFAR